MKDFTINELKLLSPHKFYNYKSGMNVKYKNIIYMFMGYIDNNKCLLSDGKSNFVAFLSDLNN